MSATYLAERKREVRLRWFGTGLGLVLAGLVHLAIFWGPEVRYRPLLEEAQVRRVLVVQPFRPAPPPPPPPKPKTPGSGTPAAAKPKPATPKPSTAAAAPPQASVTPPLIPDRKSAVTKPSETVLAPPDRGDTGAAKADSAHLDTDAAQAVTPPPDKWQKVLEEIEAQRDTLSSMTAREVAAAASTAGDGRGRGGRGGGSGRGDGGGFLDPRIRMTVVSYPQTFITEDYPPIPYPKLRFRRTELEAGICRVYYRVWTDAAGKIARRQLLAPKTQDDRQLYAAFVETVTSSVERWTFAEVNAEIHVDVLFEIE